MKLERPRHTGQVLEWARTVAALLAVCLQCVTITLLLLTR